MPSNETTIQTMRLLHSCACEIAGARIIRDATPIENVGDTAKLNARLGKPAPKHIRTVADALSDQTMANILTVDDEALAFIIARRAAA